MTFGFLYQSQVINAVRALFQQGDYSFGEAEWFFCEVWPSAVHLHC